MVRTYTAVLQGLESIKIEVEVEAIRGTPQLILIGLPTKAVDEAKERVTASLLNCGIRPKSRRTIVNLAPADLPKRGTGLELAIATCILKLYQKLKGSTDDYLFLGELSLNGDIKPIKGILPLTLSARQMGFGHIVIPRGNLAEVSLVKNIKIHPVDHLKQILDTNFDQAKLETMSPQTKASIKPSSGSKLDQILGQDQAIRALTIAAAGGHNIIFMGPPGVGKSLLAQSLVDLLPPLSQDQIMETTAIHSIVGVNQNQLVTQPPFRSPHHTISHVGLVGGGSKQITPGEISLAHNGILFLDELTEFSRISLESLRQPLESGQITHTRHTGRATFPASCMFVAASNPCPCGWFQCQKKACRCSPSARNSYLNKLSGPLLDRVDLQVWVDMPESSTLDQMPSSPKTSIIPQLKLKIAKVRKLQKQKLLKVNKTLNSKLNSADIRSICPTDQSAWQLLRLAQAKLNLSMRGVFSVLRVAQTIANLEEADSINKTHVAEALQFRTLTKMRD